MGKAEKGTPKDIANRMKAKGLQKLRWYCQMCQKQCRDENGFKCHTTSEGHQRQLLLFAENPDKYLDSFSEDFMEGYISLLKRRFGTKRVHANNVYQEYIHDRDHVHMNSTQWETLTDFVKWLGREGHCIVDETEKGWFVAYIDREPETLLKQEKKIKKEKFEKDEEERFQDFINKQVEKGKATQKAEDIKYTELKRDGESVIALDIKLNQKAKETIVKKESLTNPLKAGPSLTKEKSKKDPSSSKKRSILEEIIEEDKRIQKKHKEKESLDNQEVQAPWIVKGIIVKVITKELGSKFYKLKGVIKEVDGYAAIVKLNEYGTKLKLDQLHLETVIPNVGREVLIVQGRYKSSFATLKSLKIEKFSADLELLSGPYKGKLIIDIPYEHFSKLAT
ncbi:UNVERIFIED_CONTAM: hypothetical protein GTU68_006092 [Idotea baltica]|nr:hypothetical protein [Idotea baltica]